MNYSQRFSFSGMSGAWPSPAIQAAFTATGGTLTAVPATVNTVTNGAPNAPAAGGGAADGQYSISYQFQTTGLTKYAPMQLRPGSTITATNTAPLFPASLFTVAPTYLPTPSIVTTITQSLGFSATSIVNPVSLHLKSNLVVVLITTRNRPVQHQCLRMICRSFLLGGGIKSKNTLHIGVVHGGNGHNDLHDALA